MNYQKQEENGNQQLAANRLLVGMKITIPVLPSIGAYISDDARSCVNDDCFDLPAFSNCKFQSGKKSDFGDFEPYARKTAALYKKTDNMNK